MRRQQLKKAKKKNIDEKTQEKTQDNDSLNSAGNTIQGTVQTTSQTLISNDVSTLASEMKSMMTENTKTITTVMENLFKQQAEARKAEAKENRAFLERLITLMQPQQQMGYGYGRHVQYVTPYGRRDATVVVDMREQDTLLDEEPDGKSTAPQTPRKKTGGPSKRERSQGDTPPDRQKKPNSETAMDDAEDDSQVKTLNFDEEITETPVNMESDVEEAHQESC
jgi:hypothetical protein